jgi:sec-independent protein translocase protein TatA
MFEGLFQPTHLVVILVIALFVLGPDNVSKIRGFLGKTMGGFKKAANIIKILRRF